MGLRLCLGEALILNPGTTAFDRWLNIFADPLAWLRASRNASSSALGMGFCLLRVASATSTVLPSLKSCCRSIGAP